MASTDEIKHLRLYSEPWGFGDYGDYDLVDIFSNGEWRWEHNEHYAEYYCGQYHDSWKHGGEGVGGDYDYEPDHPTYGKNVNSMCWDAEGDSLSSFFSECNTEIECITNLSISLDGPEIILLNPTKWQTYVNVNQGFYPSGSRRIEYSPCSAPKNYAHWLSLGFQESELFAHVLYPLNPTWLGNISVLIVFPHTVKKIKWSHGCAGLFQFHIKPMVNKEHRSIRKRGTTSTIEALENIVSHCFNS